MKRIKLNRGFALVSNSDYLRVLKSGTWYAWKSKKTTYVRRNLRKRQSGPIFLHRFVLNVNDPAVLVDHKNGNGLHCWRGNLRTVTPSQSQMNRGIQSNNSSGISGVSWNKHARKYEAHVKMNRKKKHIGLFSTLSAAGKAVQAARKKHYGVFRRIA